MTFVPLAPAANFIRKLVAQELSGSDRDKIAANVHEQMEDKAAPPGAALQDFFSL